LSHCGEEASLRQKLDDINNAIEPLVSGNCGGKSMKFHFWYQHASLGSLRNEEVKIREYGRHTEQARAEAGARYMDWKNPPKTQDEKPGFSFRKALLRQERQEPPDQPDYKTPFDEAGESSERLS
jgi:hypothetical protein